jgi:hypothetical protein
MAVREIAMGSGKKIAKTGRRTVPNPNPEKKVSIEAAKAVKQIKVNMECSLHHLAQIKKSPMKTSGIFNFIELGYF